MIETMQNPQIAQSNAFADNPRKILRMVTNERMAGTVPQWSAPKTSTDNIQFTLENAQNISETPDGAIAYANGKARNQQEEFGFGDMLDMVNPLQHIPIVGHIYREITGDQIKPIGQIMGGALFGGIPGAASGIINTIVEKETGEDITGNALSLMNGEAPEGSKSRPQSPEAHLEKTAQSFNASQDASLPGSLLSFVDLKNIDGPQVQRLKNTYPDLNQSDRVRQPITEVKLSGLYALSQ